MKKPPLIEPGPAQRPNTLLNLVDVEGGVVERAGAFPVSVLSKITNMFTKKHGAERTGGRSTRGQVCAGWPRVQPVRAPIEKQATVWINKND
jgi:hypothetical protein